MSKKIQKTIFITISRGFGVRNILRSGVLEELKRHGMKVVILFYSPREKELPEYLRKEFEKENVYLEVVDMPNKSKFRRRLWKYTALLTYNKTNRKVRYAKYGTAMFLLFFENLIFVPLSKLNFLKRFFRFIEQKIFVKNLYGSYFEKYKPDVVFSTSIINSFDVEILKEARKRGIKTVAMPRGWDNVTTLFYKFVPDRLIVQNAIMKNDAIKYQDIEADKITVTGFPQFDWYRRPDILMSREEFCNRIGVDPKHKIIFWGSTGVWTPDDSTICETLIKLVQDENQLPVPTTLFIRPHFSDAIDRRFDKFKGIPHVVVDENYTFSTFFRDNFDASTKEIVQFVNTIYHADVIISLCSTLALDALCLDKPIINTAFQGFYDKKGNDISYMLYLHDHYRPLLERGAVRLVHNTKELIEEIHRYLKHPEYEHKSRQEVLEMLCYKVDGNSSKRIATEILSIM